MGLILDFYQTQCGLGLVGAYLQPVDLRSDPDTGITQFSCSVYANKDYMLEGRPPIDRNIKDGFITTPVDTSQLEEDICELLLLKIHEVDGKTEEECMTHNVNLTPENNSLNWIDYWDIELQQFWSARRETDPAPTDGYKEGPEHDGELGPEDPNA